MNLIVHALELTLGVTLLTANAQVPTSQASSLNTAFVSTDPGRSESSLHGCSLHMPVDSPPQRNITFRRGSKEIDPSQNEVLDEWVRYLQNHPEFRFAIEGHTDDLGGNEFNLKLGELRAIAVYKRLLERKIPNSQLKVVSYGEELPINPAFTDEARAINRRVNLWQVVEKKP